jgi:CcmD family protein
MKRNTILPGLAAFCLIAGLCGPHLHAAMRQQTPRTTAAQEGFVPVDQLPPEDRMPAAPLLISAYVVAWVAVFGYLWSVWRRVGRVERELAAMRARVDERAHPRRT